MRLRRGWLVAALVVLAGCSPPLDWREFTWPEGGFAVLLPGKPDRQTAEIQLGASKVRMQMFVVRTAGLLFGVGYADLPKDFAGDAVAAARDALVKNIAGKVTSERAVDVSGATGREFTAVGESQGQAVELAARMLTANGRFHQVVFIGRKDRTLDADVPLFLGSLRLLR